LVGWLELTSFFSTNTAISGTKYGKWLTDKSAAYTDSPNGGTGKTCLGGSIHCPSVYSIYSLWVKSFWNVLNVVQSVIRAVRTGYLHAAICSDYIYTESFGTAQTATAARAKLLAEKQTNKRRKHNSP